jgi:hypothetical protein
MVKQKVYGVRDKKPEFSSEKKNSNTYLYIVMIFLLLVIVSLAYMNTTYKEELQFQEAQINCYEYATTHSTIYSVMNNLNACANTTQITIRKSELLTLNKTK